MVSAAMCSLLVQWKLKLDKGDRLKTLCIFTYVERAFWGTLFSVCAHREDTVDGCDVLVSQIISSR